MYVQIVLILALLLWWVGYVSFSTGIVAVLLTLLAEKLLTRRKPRYRYMRYVQ